ncbi:hypothetical protein C8R41DRAFT_588574 [Lentinula lateritia]|uniref:Homeobox domain-containing protein n=1 Tax=Lentinula lateritia TaxID=40482 RepID=A0ABQ8V3R7_9AGAR|nr:hypothetical protein C8R41DRAFT_588574 [Lentinula lateritia]
MKGHFSTRSNKPTRTIITAEQRALLSAAIEKVHYPSDDTIEGLSNDLRISPSQIRIWFCNRRQQMRRKEKGNTARSLQPAPPISPPLSLPLPQESLNVTPAHPQCSQQQQSNDPLNDITLPSISALFPEFIKKNSNETPYLISANPVRRCRRAETQISLPPITSLLQTIPPSPTQNYVQNFPSH